MTAPRYPRFREDDLALVLAEAGPRLRGAWIQKVRARGQGFALEARRPGGGEAVVVVVGLGLPSPFVTVVPRAALVARGERVHGFSERLRALVEGARILAAAVIPGDRVLRIDLGRGAALGPAEQVTLAADDAGSGVGAALHRQTLWLALTGTTADAVLADDAGCVVASWRHMAGRRGAPEPGSVYAPPAPRPGARAVGASTATAAPDAGSNPGLAAAAADGALDAPAALPAPDSTTLALGRALLDRLAAAERAHEADLARRGLHDEIVRRERQARSAIAKLEAAVAAGADADDAQHTGDLLLASYHLLRPGLDAVVVPDYYAPLDQDGAPPPRRIALDPALPPEAQAERWFRRARKARRGAEVAAARLAEKRSALETLTWARASLEAGDDALPIARALGLAALLAPRAQPGRPAAAARGAPSGPRRFHSADGFALLVGRTSAENDTLTLRIAGPRDLFFHTGGFPGSHVIVRAAGREVPPETVLDAATLAVHYSKARDHGGAVVHYTEQKHVRKPRGAPPGRVVLERHQTLWVAPDPQRLARVLGSAAAARGEHGAGGDAEEEEP